MSISVSNLRKSFKDKKRGLITAIDDISFGAPNASIFGLLGANGAGKTTTLQVICTLLRPDQGTVTINGFDVKTQAQRVREQIGYLPSETATFKDMTAREVLTFFGRLCKYDSSRLKARVEELIESLAMAKFADAYCQQLSSGMLRKVAFARAIVHNPSVLILDEPTANLDVLSSLAVHDLIAQVRAQGKCVLLSTHNLTEAEKLCDEIAVIQQGKIVAAGSKESLQSQWSAKALEEFLVSVSSERSQ